jgi:hypothetical protein
LIYIPKKEGVKGKPPLGCFPLWGREGVILQAATDNKRIERKEDFTRAGISGNKKLPGRLTGYMHNPISFKEVVYFFPNDQQ